MALCKDNHISAVAQAAAQGGTGNGIMLLMKCLTQTSGAAKYDLRSARRWKSCSSDKTIIGLTALDEQMVLHAIFSRKSDI